MKAAYADASEENIIYFQLSSLKLFLKPTIRKMHGERCIM